MLSFILWYTLVLSALSVAIQIADKNPAVRVTALVIYLPLLVTIPIYLSGT